MYKYKQLYKSYVNKLDIPNAWGGGGVTEQPCSWGKQIEGPGPPGLEILNIETIKYGRESHGTQTQQQLKTTEPTSRQRGRPTSTNT
jgi:hypothetical protein